MSKLKPKGPIKSRSLEDLLVELQSRPSRGRSKVQVLDGIPHRERRGKLVAIPAEWFGHVTHKQTIRKRPAKQGQGPSYAAKVQR